MREYLFISVGASLDERGVVFVSGSVYLDRGDGASGGRGGSDADCELIFRLSYRIAIFIVLAIIIVVIAIVAFVKMGVAHVLGILRHLYFGEGAAIVKVRNGAGDK